MPTIVLKRPILSVVQVLQQSLSYVHSYRLSRSENVDNFIISFTKVCQARRFKAAEIKIQCKDTIHFGISAAAIRQEIQDLGLNMSDPVRGMLGG